MELLIVADDLTGALDTALPFVREGISTRATTDCTLAKTPLADDAQVLVVDAETRHLPPEQAGKRVAELAARAKALGVRRFLKKTDSTLRGNIASELAALLEAAGEKRLCFFPAYPKMGRTTRGGIHFIDGVPLAESAFGRDLLNPVKTSAVAGLFAGVKGISVQNIPVGAAPFPAGKTREILVFDAETTEELRSGYQSWINGKEPAVLAGCAGLADVMAELWRGSKQADSATSVHTGGLLVLCGSLNPVTQRQLAYAAANGFCRLRLPLPEQGGLEAAECRGFLREFERACRENGRVIVDTRGSGAEVLPRREGPEWSARIPKLFGELFVRWTAWGLDQAAFITGGDTLLGCIHAAGGAIQPVRELYPGVPLNLLETGKGTVPAVSKSGGFGAETLLKDICGIL